MIITFEFRPKPWFDSEVLTSGKSFMIFDVNCKHVG